MLSKSLKLRILPLVCAAMMAACGGSDGRREDRAAESLQGKNQAHPIALTGCVQAGTLETKFVLENVRTTPEAQSDQPASGAGQSGGDRGTPSANEENPQRPVTIADGSIVQLRTDDEPALHKYVGQEVNVTGRLVDSGANTIGTGGTQGNRVPSGDRSMAASTEEGHAEKKAAEAGPIARSSMANGTAPIVEVQSVTPTGHPCGRAR